MPAFTTDPHHYDAVAGFDTSALFSAGAFNVAALQDGTGGVAIAAAARAAGSTAGGLALIAAVAADQGVSPIWTYTSFAGRTKALGGSAADLNAVGAAIAGRFANPVAGVTDSLSDLSSASGAGQIAFADVIGLVVGIAAAGTDRLTLLAGMTLGNVVQQQPRGGEGGEGGGSEGGAARPRRSRPP
ncbi:hypothetical protein [Methyloraptor flagellatus]|uniref:DUF637 domain-containing protein n=1 Tax=Methyloraptor flagellatus TaxID=3162530 RepID=A0AAU7XD35_9HYPH